MGTVFQYGFRSIDVSRARIDIRHKHKQIQSRLSASDRFEANDETDTTRFQQRPPDINHRRRQVPPDVYPLTE